MLKLAFVSVQRGDQSWPYVRRHVLEREELTKAWRSNAGALASQQVHSPAQRSSDPPQHPPTSSLPHTAEPATSVFQSYSLLPSQPDQALVSQAATGASWLFEKSFT